MGEDEDTVGYVDHKTFYNNEYCGYKTNIPIIVNYVTGDYRNDYLDYHVYSPLLIAAEKGYLDIVNLLLNVHQNRI
jgi:hypothetical protein